MSDLNINDLPAFDFDDLHDNALTVAPRNDEYAPHGAVNVVGFTVGGLSLSFLAEEAAEIASAILTAALVAKGEKAAAGDAAITGLKSALIASLARSAYESGIYPEAAAA